jgi:hypothetical protein
MPHSASASALSEADDAAVVAVEYFAQLLCIMVGLEVEHLDELLVRDLWQCSGVCMRQ